MWLIITPECNVSRDESLFRISNVE